jgi:D-tyrosyl-tRNA(Tyr) deacylase
MSVMDMDYQVLLVSQFTLLAKTKKGSKPDFHGACPPALAADIYTSLLDKTRALYVGEKGLAQEDAMTRVQDGVFGAMMQVALVNDGPVTFELSTPEKPEIVTSNKGGKKEKNDLKREGKGDTSGNVIQNGN